jgi:murein DD-endopeptidase MepM/ murein hydrolase activator NlpD
MRLLPLIAAAALIVPASALGWAWPVAGPVLTGFSFDPAHPYAAGQHRGIDIGADTGAPVVAPASGVVSFAGSVPGGGKTVTIQTPEGYSVTLVHLGSYGVRRGETIREGDPVGTIGPSGVPELDVP